MDLRDPTPDPPVGPDLGGLAEWAPQLAQTFAVLASDIALVIGGDGVISTVAQAQPVGIHASGWVGQRWVETVVQDSRHKLGELLDEVGRSGVSERHEVNHGEREGAAPVAWRAVRLGAAGPLLAVGQDLRLHAQLQQRFLEAQQAMERSYWNARRLLQREADDRPLMTPRERHSLGLAPAPHLDDPGGDAADALKLALERLQQRIGKDTLQELLRDARRLAEHQFLRRALLRAGSVEALARALGVSRRTLLRRFGSALRTMNT